MPSCNPLGQGKSKTRTRASPSSSGSAARLLGTVKATLEAQAKLSKAQIIVVAGHIHNYQRFFQNGVTYLVSGGGGAKPHPVARTPADLFQDKAFPNYHYIRFDFDGSQLNAVMYRLADPKANPVVGKRETPSSSGRSPSRISS